MTPERYRLDPPAHRAVIMRLWKHIRDIVLQVPVIVVVHASSIPRDPRCPVQHDYQAHAQTNTIWITPPTTEAEYAAALHEIGHVRSRHFRETHTPQHEILRFEAEAWHWAMHNALYWSADMHESLEWGLVSHMRHRHGLLTSVTHGALIRSRTLAEAYHDKTDW